MFHPGVMLLQFTSTMYGDGGGGIEAEKGVRRFSILNFLEYINSRGRGSVKYKAVAVVGYLLLPGHFIWGSGIS